LETVQTFAAGARQVDHITALVLTYSPKEPKTPLRHSGRPPLTLDGPSPVQPATG